MSISMRLYLAPDSDLRAFGGAPKTLQKWLRQPRVPADMWLQERWRDIDAILATGTLEQGRYSPLTAEGSDFTYPSAADHGAYALSSTSTERLYHALGEVSRDQVEAYLLDRSVTRTELPSETEELLAHLGCLDEACRLAVGKRYGLLMALWELEPG
jgi:hypothetical protein